MALSVFGALHSSAQATGPCSLTPRLKGVRGPSGVWAPRASAEQGVGGCRVGIFLPNPLRGPLLDAPGTSDFSAAGWLAIDREEAGGDGQGKLLGSLPVRTTPGQPTGVFAGHFLVPSQQPWVVAGNQGTSPS